MLLVVKLVVVSVCIYISTPLCHTTTQHQFHDLVKSLPHHKQPTVKKIPQLSNQFLSEIFDPINNTNHITGRQSIDAYVKPNPHSTKLSISYSLIGNISSAHFIKNKMIDSPLWVY